jgi:hypothetical protein
LSRGAALGLPSCIRRGGADLRRTRLTDGTDGRTRHPPMGGAGSAPKNGHTKNSTERTMKTRLLATALIAASLGAALPAADAATLIVRTAPPPLLVETVPAPRAGYQWVGGHWEWRGNQYVWESGTWVKERPGYVYYAPTWVEHEGRWERHEARWGRRDDDRDGVPNAVDRHPENPVKP